jgi:hypothetical protein
MRAASCVATIRLQAAGGSQQIENAGQPRPDQPSPVLPREQAREIPSSAADASIAVALWSGPRPIPGQRFASACQLSEVRTTAAQNG